MIVEWLIYALVVSALVSIAAWLAEGGARAQRWPTRWIWAGSMVFSVGVPLIAWVSPAPPSAPLAAAAGAYVLESLPSIGMNPTGPPGPHLSTLMLAGWAVVSLVLLSLLAVLSLRLRLRGRSWPRRVVDGVEVLVSRSIGPAAMGLLRGHVVVPEWALGLAPSQRKLLVLHEAEHVRARDPLLATVGLVLCALAPWNLPLCWQLRRLRLAVEVDCDARVLRQSDDRRSYGVLLLTVGHRKASLPLTLALTESSTMLERRIRMITNTTTGRATVRALMLAGVAGAVLAVACETPEPTDAAGPDAPLTRTSLEQSAEVAAEPTFTPMTQPPQLVNASETSARLQDRYPPLLRNAGIGGTANVWFFIDETGSVVKTQVNRSSGHEALDQAALAVAREMEFEPALNGEEPVAVWVALDIKFDVQ